MFVIAARFARYASLCGLALSLANPAFSQRRDFAASYKLTNISQQINNVRVTIELTIQNFSGKDIQDGGVVLYNSEPHISALGAYGLINSLPSNQEVTVRQSFIVPKSEYTHWQWGANPKLQFLMPDGHGGTLPKPIDLRRETVTAKAAE